MQANRLALWRRLSINSIRCQHDIAATKEGIRRGDRTVRDIRLVMYSSLLFTRRKALHERGTLDEWRINTGAGATLTGVQGI